MKSKIAVFPAVRLQAVWLAAGMVLAMAGGPTAAAAEEKDQGANDSFTVKMKQWEARMSDEFQDAWRQLWQEKDATNRRGASLTKASIDLREQPDCYSVRVNLPGRNLANVEVTMTGTTVHIVAPAEGKAGRYEQSVRLERVAADAKPVVERRPGRGLLVVTIPKAAGPAEPGPALSHPTPSIAATDPWDRDVLERMQQMQREMNHIFSDGFAEFSGAPGFRNFFNEPRFDSSLDLKDDGTKYVVRAYLPDRDMNNVNVKIKGRTLEIEAKAENSQTPDKAGSVYSEESHYSQVLTLPGPVAAAKMKVTHQKNMLVVTVPKAAVG